MQYADICDVSYGFRELNDAETFRCYALLEEAAALIDAYNPQADDARKKLVSCRMVRRQLGADEQGAVTYPTGATQGSASALGYTQSWTLSGGSVGELYLSKLEKRLLGVSNRIGASSPLEDLR